MNIVEQIIQTLGSEEAAFAYFQSVLAGAEQRPDLPRVHITETVTLAKYDGEYSPDKAPVEVIHASN